jgi:hypothetical protein
LHSWYVIIWVKHFEVFSLVIWGTSPSTISPGFPAQHFEVFSLVIWEDLPKHNIPRVPSSTATSSKNFMCFMYRRRFCNRYFQIWGLVLRLIGQGEGSKIRKVPVMKLSRMWIWNLAWFFSFLFSPSFCSFSLYVLIIIKAIFWDTSIALSWQMERISQGTMTSCMGLFLF